MIFRALARTKKAFWDAVTRSSERWADLFRAKEEVVSAKKRYLASPRSVEGDEFGTGTVKKVGAPLGTYSRTRSRTLKKTLDPEWGEDLELYLEGGRLDAQGNLSNRYRANHHHHRHHHRHHNHNHFVDGRAIVLCSFAGWR